MTKVQHKQLIIAALLFVCNVPVGRENRFVTRACLCTTAKVIEEDKLSACAVEHGAMIEIVSLAKAATTTTHTHIHTQADLTETQINLPAIVSEHCGRFYETQTYF